jgi:hypothetical protein
MFGMKQNLRSQAVFLQMPLVVFKRAGCRGSRKFRKPHNPKVTSGSAIIPFQIPSAGLNRLAIIAAGTVLLRQPAATEAIVSKTVLPMKVAAIEGGRATVPRNPRRA